MGVKAIISKSALLFNYNLLKKMAPKSKVAAVIKANAYGHGLLEVAKTLAQVADLFAVARISEALYLRENGIKNDILLLEGFLLKEDLSLIIQYNLDTVVQNLDQIKHIQAINAPNELKVWMKIDTGMHRLGFRPEECDHAYDILTKCNNVKKISLISHLATSDELNNDYTSKQIDCFNRVTSNYVGDRSLANSAGILFWPQSHNDIVRSGVALYGISPLAEDLGSKYGLKPVMTLSTLLIAVRKHKKGESVGYGRTWIAKEDTNIGVISIGYGDGFLRTIPNESQNSLLVLINGRLVPIIGRVSMDMITIDLGESAIDKIGDEVIIWGDMHPIEKTADKIGTIAYDLLARLTDRVCYEYKE